MVVRASSRRSKIPVVRRTTIKVPASRRDENADYSNRSTGAPKKSLRIEHRLVNRQISKAKRQQRTYPLSLKAYAVHLHSKGIFKSEISRQLGVPESTSRGWIKNFYVDAAKDLLNNNGAARPNANAPPAAELQSRDPRVPEQPPQPRRDVGQAEAEVANILLSLQWCSLRQLTCRIVGVRPSKVNKIYFRDDKVTVVKTTTESFKKFVR